MTTKREINSWLKNNLSVRARVMSVNHNMVTIGADASVNLSAMAEQIRNGIGATKAFTKSANALCLNHLTLQF